MSFTFRLVLSVILSLPAYSILPDFRVDPNADAKLPLYYGENHQQAAFQFESEIFINKSKGYPTESLLRTELAYTAKYIMGKMRRMYENPSALHPKFNSKILKVENADSNFYRVFYSFSGLGAFSGKDKTYAIYVPYYARGLFKKSQGACTKESKVDESNFWYHWDPEISSCPLRLETDYARFSVNLNYISNTEKSYPEYERLIKNNSLKISLFFGLEDYKSKDWVPDNNTDHNSYGYQIHRNFLINDLGFSRRQWSKVEVRKYYNPSAGHPLPFIEEFTKETPSGLVIVRMFFLNTGLYYDSKAFHTFFALSAAQDAVVIYNGHSGIGKNLDISAIESLRGIKINFSQNYQIMFLGSCVPYSYYTEKFFRRKRTSNDPLGTKNLDLITYGNESLFGETDDFRLIKAVMTYMETKERTSYQDIINENSYGDDFYLGVNGDEDNPTN